MEKSRINIELIFLRDEKKAESVWIKVLQD